LSDGASAAAERPRRERRNRRAQFPRANSYHAPIVAGPEDLYPPARFARSEFQQETAAAIVEKHGIQGVSYNPTAVDAEVRLYVSLAISSWHMVKRSGDRLRVFVAEPAEDRRRRPHGYSDVAMSKACRMNHWRTQRARLRANKRAGGVVITRQPHRFNEEKGRFEGLPGIHELPPRFFELHGIPWAKVEAEYERRETERKLKEQLEGQRRAEEQQDARNRRGADHPLIEPQRPRAQRTVASRVLDLPVDADGRCTPRTVEDNLRVAELAFADDLKDLSSDERRARAIARWREEKEPPT